jgi:hypothetical protein
MEKKRFVLLKGGFLEFGIELSLFRALLNDLDDFRGSGQE